jgi:hypothetical protein
MDDSVKTFQRIQILLAEYTTMRAELLSRYTAQFQSGGIAAIVFLGIVTLMANTGRWSFAGLIALDILIFLAVLFWIDIDIAKAARRLRALEAEINAMAAGTPLLKWETLFGMGGIVGERYLKWKERRAASATGT